MMTDEGEGKEQNWVAPDSSSDSSSDSASSLPESPSPAFAPTGRPTLRPSFRTRLPTDLEIKIPESANPALTKIQDTYTVGYIAHFNKNCFADSGSQKAVTTRIDPADNSKFLEQFRYTIVASQLLSSQALLSQVLIPSNAPPNPCTEDEPEQVSTTGVLLAVAGSYAIAWVSKWINQGGISALTRKRTSFILIFVATVLFLLVTHTKRQRLRYLRDQALTEVSMFISASQDFDSATAAAIALIQEVELVSRGYRL